MRYVAVSRALVLFILISLCAFAQRDLGTITGTITDPQGAGIPSARVTITEDATGLSYTVQSTQLGEFVRPLLKAGTYTITVEMQGFRKAEQKGVIVTPGDRIAANITLQVGQIDQTVEVMAAAPLLQTESTVQGANLNTSEVSELPLGGQRTFTYSGAAIPRRTSG